VKRVVLFAVCAIAATAAAAQWHYLSGGKLTIDGRHKVSIPW
jgi:hypothetical protein